MGDRQMLAVQSTSRDGEAAGEREGGEKELMAEIVGAHRCGPTLDQPVNKGVTHLRGAAPQGGTMATNSSLDPRTPVLVGGGQINNRVDQGAAPLEPVDLMVEALRGAAVDSGVGNALLEAADSIRVINLLSWRYRDPGALLGERIGASPRHTAYTVIGGNYVQTLVNRTGLDILEGKADVVILAGAEAWRTRSDTRKSGVEVAWTKQGDDVPAAEQVGDDKDLMGPGEVARGIFMPVQVYPLFENALRAVDGLSLDEHRARLGDLYARFSQVAADNPHAWNRDIWTAEQLTTPTPDNRMVGLPYTKRLNSNNMTEQGAAVVMCSLEKARSLGVADDAMVFLHAGADAHDHWFVSTRADLHSSPAMRFTGTAALSLAGIGVDDLAHVDLYSCFPSAVQIAAREIGLGLDRQLTVTGGMSFAGGPWNNYVMHSIATMLTVLRNDPGTHGLVTANGGYLTKHAMGVYSTTPPAAGAFRWQDCQAEVDATRSVGLDPEPDGRGTIETYTVMHGRDSSAEQGIAAVTMPDGRRAWGITNDADLMARMSAEEMIGTPITISPDGSLKG